MITKDQAIDILEKFNFFHGQRAGRELWNEKSFEVQEQDISNFSKDCKLLIEYIAEGIPFSEGEWVDAWGKDKCTICGFECDDPYYLGQANYCPECGSKMTRKD